jgi:hypothetical protein
LVPFFVGLLAQSLGSFLGSLLVADIDPLASLVVLSDKSTRRIAIPDGTDNDPCNRWLLDLGSSDVVGAV